MHAPFSFFEFGGGESREESLGFAVRSLGFAVPGAIGVLEGGFVLIGILLGIDSSAALTVALVKRLREVILGVPAILGWFIQEAVRPGGP